VRRLKCICQYTKLPVCYQNQKNTWVTRNIYELLFLNWFNSEFDPNVRHHLSSISFPIEAVLLLDNCPGYLSTEELCSKDIKIFAMFLPPNTNCFYLTNGSECYSKHYIELLKKITFKHCCR